MNGLLHIFGGLLITYNAVHVLCHMSDILACGGDISQGILEVLSSLRIAGKGLHILSHSFNGLHGSIHTGKGGVELRGNIVDITFIVDCQALHDFHHAVHMLRGVLHVLAHLNQ